MRPETLASASKNTLILESNTTPTLASTEWTITSFSTAQVTTYQLSKRRRAVGKIGCKHMVNKDEAMKWFQQKYDGVIFNVSADELI